MNQFNRALAESGYTENMLKASEYTAEILRGMKYGEALSVMMNISAMIICESAKTESEAMNEAHHLHREVRRTIEKNWPHLKKNAEEGR